MRKLFFSFLSISSILFAQEPTLTIYSDPQNLEPEQLDLSSLTSTQEYKIFPYGSMLYILPGIGLSFRSKNGYQGYAIDMDASTVIIATVSTGSLSLTRYVKATSSSPYVSAGVGMAGSMEIFYGSLTTTPIVPLRVGMEWKYGFVDAGALVTIGGPPVPQLRAGVGFRF
jgi:hypothetical protein